MSETTKKTFDKMKSVIDAKLISANTSDGLCTFYSILNGYHFKQTGELRITEERFKDIYNSVYNVLLKYKEEFRYVRVHRAIDLLDDLNQSLQQFDFCINVYCYQSANVSRSKSNRNTK